MNLPVVWPMPANGSGRPPAETPTVEPLRSVRPSLTRKLAPLHLWCAPVPRGSGGEPLAQGRSIRGSVRARHWSPRLPVWPMGSPSSVPREGRGRANSAVHRRRLRWNGSPSLRDPRPRRPPLAPSTSTIGDKDSCGTKSSPRHVRGGASEAAHSRHGNPQVAQSGRGVGALRTE